MKTKLRLISAILIMSLVFPLFSGIIQPVFAATMPLNIYIDQNSYKPSAGTLILRWENKPNITDVTITYHVPGTAGVDTITVPPGQIDISKNSATITQIKNDIIYDFNIKITDGSQDYVGKQYFLPQISVYSEQVDQQPVTVTGGGVETGVYPAIKLSWNMPVIYNSSKNTMEYANTKNSDGSGPLNQIDGNIRKMNFTFHISKEDSLEDVLIQMNPNDDNPDTMYSAILSDETDTSNSSSVKWDATSGKYSFYILGVKDSLTPSPTMDEIHLNEYSVTKTPTLPKEISQAGDNVYVLPHPEVLPGSIYVITMNTLFYDNSTPNQYIGTVASGLSDIPLMGATNYTYTPIRFQLTKDSQDLIYVRIHRVNSGSIKMPSLYYEIQTSNVPSDQDSSWTFRSKLDDKNFPEGAESAIDVIDGINPKNTVYYRVVVKSESVNDRIQSLKLPYKMQDDTARPPVPRNISIAKVELEQVPAAKGEKSSNITIIWDKPSNWDQIVSDASKDIYFHFLLNIGPKDEIITPKPMLEADGMQYDYYDVKYRLVKYVSAHSGKITTSPDGSKLVYTLNGLELFKWVDESGKTWDMTNNDTEKYPNYLLPNKTYYMLMYTTLAVDKGEETDSLKMSDKSLTESFTTLSPTGRDVPIPEYLEWVDTKINPSNPADATVKVRFNDLKIDWNNYSTNHKDTDIVLYDLYMSTSTELKTFKKIGTMENKGDVAFTTQILGATTWWYATVNKFTGDNITRFGNTLAPNTTYYFMVKVRLSMVDQYGNPMIKESVGTALLPVTTPRGEPTTPDESEKKPLAPTDFAIAEDSDGNPMVTGQSVTFEWTVQENAAAYNLIATTQRVDPDALDTDGNILEDSIYKSFISIFGNKDNNIDGNSKKLTLDPKQKQLPGNFEYDSVTKKCRYTINTWIYPNKVYYFSLRSEVENSKGIKSSLWISIPVTTTLIESPSMLQVVSNCELSFYWYDTLSDMTTENYNIMLKAKDETNYTQLLKSQYTIVKAGTIYYFRSTPAAKLKPNTQYSIKVIRTTNDVATNNKELSTQILYTRDDYYQIDVKWQGFTIDPFSGFEIAIRTEDDTDYTVLTNSSDLEQYFDTSTQTKYPYYIEKSNSNVNSNYYTYNARIKFAEVTLPDGTKEHRTLKPNTKYYIKVRAVRYDSSNMKAFTYSKYIGPVNTRTEFNQDDYDEEDNNTSIAAKFLDMLDNLEQDVFWEVNKKNGATDKILVKDDKIINLLEGYGYFTCTIDISQSPGYVNNDEIYLGKDILKAMKNNNKSIIIKAKEVEYTIRPETFNIDEMEEFKKAKAVTDSKDVYLKINNSQNESTKLIAPANTTAASKINILSAQAVTSKQTSATINALIKDKLYNDKTGIIQKKLAIIKNPNNSNVKGDTAEVNKYLNQILEELKSELSYYLEDTLNGAGYTAGVFADKFEISKFYSPLAVKMPYKANSISNPYVLYGNIGNWQKLTQNLKYDTDYLNYFVTGTGKYAIFSSKDISDTVSDENSAKPYISKLAAKYDLTTVFPEAEVSFNSDLNVTVKELILLYELISETKNDEQTDIKAKAKAYGIDKIINITNIYRNINRQEAAAIIIKMYCQKSGTDYDKIKASYSKTIKDDSKIAEKYSVPVYVCLQMDLMTLDSNTNFNPQATINRAGLVMVIEKMLEA
jgi:hypothetical protein